MDNAAAESKAQTEVNQQRRPSATDATNVEAPSNKDVDDVCPRPKGLGLRHVQVLLLFTCMVLAYSLRVNMSIGIVAMMDNTANPAFVQYDWSESVRNLILSSFFWGYVVSQVPAGLLAQRFGAKILLVISMGLCSLVTLLTPIAPTLGWEWLCAARVIQGLGQGFLYPSAHTLLARWVHPSERGFLSTFTYSGTQMGTVGMLAVSGVIAASSTGWPGIFYISGGLTAVWTVVWVFLGCDSPSVAKHISPAEKKFIESAAGCETSDAPKQTPWLSILRSVPFWALLVAHSAQNWGFWTLLTEIPTYMNKVLEFDIKSNALLSAMPYLVMWLLMIAFSELSDFVVNRRCLSVGAARKVFNTIGHWVPAAALVALGYVTKEHTPLAIVLLTVAVAVNGAAFVGYLVNHMDLSPNFAGTLMGLTNCVSNFMSLLGPLFVSVVVTDAEDPDQWRIVFFVAAAIFFVGNSVFVLLGSGRLQAWNELPATSSDVGAVSPTKRTSSSTDTVETADIADVAATNKSRS